jgi:sulfite exporter TauE/SafE
MVGPLLLGFLLGMKHALEADHVAAVAALATRSPSMGERIKLAGMWGLGHAGTIVIFGALVLALGLSLPPALALAQVFEGAVGLMLIALGVDVLRRLRTRRVHFHTHQHGDGTHHFHAHAHERARPHEPAHHVHEHPGSPLPRALLVGTVHGLAGSAALVLLSLEVARSAPQAFAYVATFALGSLIGMCALSLAISLPLRILPARLGVATRRLEGALGLVTIALGSWIAVTVAFGP